MQQEKNLYMCLFIRAADIRGDMFTNGNALKGLSMKREIEKHSLALVYGTFSQQRPEPQDCSSAQIANPLRSLHLSG